MASGDTDVSICSDALILLGENEISSFKDGTDPAKVCSRLYPDTKVWVLGMYPWTWSIKKTQLSRSVDAAEFEWRYKYILPGDLIVGPRAVYNTNSTSSSPITAWERNGDFVYTDQETIYIDYQYAVQESVMPAYFVQLLKMAVASVIAETVTEQTTKSDYWHRRAFGQEFENGRGGYFRQATQMDGQNTVAEAIENFELVVTRNSI